MPVREYDTWFRVEIYENGRWFTAPTVDGVHADHDTEDDAIRWAQSVLPGLRRSDYRAPVRGQWRVHKVRGSRD